MTNSKSFLMTISVVNLLFLSGCGLNTNSLINSDSTDLGNSVQVANVPTLQKWDQEGCDWKIIDNVLDGDTIKLSDGNIVRLIGIDSPESNVKQNQYEYFANENIFFVKDTINEDQICLKEDSLVPSIDPYGRLQRYVYTKDGNFLNTSLVRWGYAKVLNEMNFSYRDLFSERENQAKTENLGIWDIDNKIKYYGGIEKEIDISEKENITNISYKVARDFIGKKVTVNLKVNSTYQNPNEIFLNAEDEFANPNNFTIVIPSKYYINFSVKKISPLSFYRNKNISITGKIEEVRGNVRIYIASPEDIIIVE